MDYSSLKTILESIWDTRVKPLYKIGKIQTERHLQAYLFMWLKEELTKTPESDWEVWVEPQFYLATNYAQFVQDKKSSKLYKPDLVITEGSKIACFIELKFTPQQHNVEKNLQAAKNDISKLELYCNGVSTFPEVEISTAVKDECGNFFLELDPEGGWYRRPVYQRSADTIYAFLGIARYGSTDGKQKLWEYLSEKLPHSILVLKVSDSASDSK